MSILIKNMEMPTYDGVFPCRLRVENGVAKLEIDYIITAFMDERKIYPLVPVPPHGRLIEADALADIFRGFIALYDTCPFNQLSLSDKSRRDELQAALAEVINAPTIVPAEEGEK